MMAKADYEIVYCREHYEVYIKGMFYCSADTIEEASREIEKYYKEEIEA